MNIFLVIVGFILLVVGGEFLVSASVAVFLGFKISNVFMCLPVLSFATSAPELLVSLQAALSGFSDISLGNIIGSNIANIGLVLGITAIISSITIDKDFLKFNYPVMLLMSGLLYLFLYSEEELTRVEGLALLFILFLFILIFLIIFVI